MYMIISSENCSEFAKNVIKMCEHAHGVVFGFPCPEVDFNNWYFYFKKETAYFFPEYNVTKSIPVCCVLEEGTYDLFEMRREFWVYNDNQIVHVEYAGHNEIIEEMLVEDINTITKEEINMEINNNTILNAQDNNKLHNAQVNFVTNVAKLGAFDGLKSVPNIIRDKINEWNGLNVSELYESIMEYLNTKKDLMKETWDANTFKKVEETENIIDSALVIITQISRKVWDFCKGLGSSAKIAFIKYGKILKDTFLSLCGKAMELIKKAGSAVAYAGAFAFKIAVNVGKTIMKFLTYLRDKIRGKISDMVDDWDIDDPDSVGNAVDAMMANMNAYNPEG